MYDFLIFLFWNFLYHISLWELYDLIFIKMTSRERHVVWNHRSFECLFHNLWGPTSKKHQNPLYWSFVRGIHRWLGDSPHKGPVTRKKLPFDDVIMLLYNVFLVNEIAVPHMGTIRYPHRHGLGLHRSHQCFACHTVPLTHLPLDKMAAISQTIFSCAFSWMKSFVSWFRFHRNLFLMVQLMITKHWLR